MYLPFYEYMWTESVLAGAKAAVVACVATAIPTVCILPRIQIFYRIFFVLFFYVFLKYTDVII